MQDNERVEKDGGLMMPRPQLNTSATPCAIVSPSSPHDPGPAKALPQTTVAEYTKPELERLIADLEDIVQALEDGTRSNKSASLSL